MPLVLASSSPRRRLLLGHAGVQIAAVHPPDVPEVRALGEDPLAFAARVASLKAAAVTVPGHHVLAADTVVHLDGTVYAKPEGDEDARRMLRALAGRWHLVTTAWCLRWEGAGEARLARADLCTTRVRLRPLTVAEIDLYVATGECGDKAGSYAIQGIGGALVAEVEGSYTNVIGLPLDQVIPALIEAGMAPEVS